MTKPPLAPVDATCPDCMAIIGHPDLEAEQARMQMFTHAVKAHVLPKLTLLFDSMQAGLRAVNEAFREANEAFREAGHKLQEWQK